MSNEVLEIISQLDGPGTAIAITIIERHIAEMNEMLEGDQVQSKLNTNSEGYMKIRLTGGQKELPKRVADMESRGWEVVQIYASPNRHHMGDLDYNKHVAIMRRK